MKVISVTARKGRKNVARTVPAFNIASVEAGPKSGAVIHLKGAANPKERSITVVESLSEVTTRIQRAQG